MEIGDNGFLIICTLQTVDKQKYDQSRTALIHAFRSFGKLTIASDAPYYKFAGTQRLELLLLPTNEPATIFSSLLTIVESPNEWHRRTGDNYLATWTNEKASHATFPALEWCNVEPWTIEL